MSIRPRLEMVVTSVVAGSIGFTTWMLAMSTAERFSYGPDQDMGNPAIYPVLVSAAIIGGLIVPRQANVVGLALGLPGLILSPWTTPRGDNDGLWIMIVPLLATFILVLAGAASTGRWARPWLISLGRDDQASRR